MSTIPPVLKPITSYIRRAEELDRDTSRPESVLVAYFCRSYAMELGIPLVQASRDQGATAFLNALIQQLEAAKKGLPAFTQEEGQTLMTEFAHAVFARADEEDRAGLADKGTARTFYAAANFYDALAQFGDLAPEPLQKKKYAKWKAAEILKAVKEGRDPAPGGFGEETAKVVTPRSAEAKESKDSEPAPFKPPNLDRQPTLEDLIPVAPGAEAGPPLGSPVRVPPPAAAAAAAPAAAPAPAAAATAPAVVQAKASSGMGKPTKNAAKISDAKELLSFAMRSLDKKDSAMAIQRIEQALGILKSG